MRQLLSIIFLVLAFLSLPARSTEIDCKKSYQDQPISVREGTGTTYELDESEFIELCKSEVKNETSNN